MSFEVDDDVFESDGSVEPELPKAVINAAIWVNETVDSNVSFTMVDDEESFLLGYGLFNPVSVLLAFIGVSTLRRNDLVYREKRPFETKVAVFRVIEDCEG